ncbi:hypothetical protein, partial [Bifidobacterium longum]
LRTLPTLDKVLHFYLEPGTMRKILAASAALITLFTLSACGSDTANIPQCENEDGSGQAGLCYWDSARMGNGRGTGLYIYQDGVLIGERY